MTTEELERTKRFMTADIASNSRCDIWIEMAAIQVSKQYFGNSYCLAVSYFASHIGTLETRGNADEVGSIASKSEGSISVSFSHAGSGTDDDLLQTTYGRMYLNLRQSCRLGPNITGSFGFGGI